MMEAFWPWDSPVPTAWKYLKETKNAWCTLEMMQSICSAVKIAGTNGFIVSPQQRSQPRKNWWLPDGAAMSILVINKKCPQCESIERYRIKRSLWMRLIPKSRYYMCDHCDGRFISVDDSFSVYWPFGKAAWGSFLSPPMRPTYLNKWLVFPTDKATLSSRLLQNSVFCVREPSPSFRKSRCDYPESRKSNILLDTGSRRP